MDKNLIIFDNHLHLRRNGRFIEAVKDFKKAGGTHLILCQYPMPELVIKEKSYKPAYKETLDMANEIRKKVDIGIFITVGPYPVDYLSLIKHFDRKKTIEIMKKGIDEAANLINENKVVGIGEIGRPHFTVDEKIIRDSNEILSYAMKIASEINSPVILHTESTTAKQCKELVEMGRKEGLAADKIVKHYSPPLILSQENFGLVPSVLASKKNILNAAKKGTRFMMETDYIDDPRRPGAVLGPKTVPKRSFELLEKNILSESELNIIHKIIPEKTYGIELKA